MRLRVAVCAALVLLLPRLAFAAQGILLLADEGKPEWNSQVAQLAARVDKQKPTEIAIWSGANQNLQVAVNRLIKRGASEIVAVPLFIADPPVNIGAIVKSSVPIRMTTPLDRDPVVVDIVMARAQGISRNPGSEVLMIASHHAATGADRRWIPDLRTAAQQLNGMRRFVSVLTATVPPDGAPPISAVPLRNVLERYIASGRRIVVVPLVTPYGDAAPAIKERLQGLAHDVATSGLMPDDRLVAWILSQAAGK